MALSTAWRAITQQPGRFLTSAWPWRALAYLLCGAAPIATVAVLFASPAGAGLRQGPTLVIVALLLLAVLFMTPAVVRFESWRLRLLDAEPPQRDGHTAVERGYGVLAVLVLSPIDLAMLGAALFVPVWLMLTGESLKFVVGLVILPLAAYPVTVWAGARAALARAFLAPRDPDADRRLVEVTRSRARLVDAFQSERQRIERDLHDGTQQRLVALTVALGLARLDLPDGSDAAVQVRTAHEHAKQALAELREIIHGVHPQILTDRGLPAAITDAAGRVPIPVRVDVLVPRRPPVTVEVAAYFAVCEALANIAKHSRARRAWIQGRITGGQLVIELGDNGIGGADPEAGTGLAGLADRLAVVDGRLLLSSPRGGPTVLRMEIPCPETVHSG